VEIVACTQTEDHSVVDLEVKLLKILMFATNGEKGFSRDNFCDIYAIWLNIKIEL
jgi:hypothetical protein